MQPTYLPWAGYFNLMKSVDVFVFLDDAQFQKNSWHSRNRLLIAHQPHWITVPVKHIAVTQQLTETLLCEEKHWRRKHSVMLQQTYARHPHKIAVEEISTFLLQDDSKHLADLNINLIRYISLKLGITTPVKLSSEMLVEGRRTEKVLNILLCAQATQYLSPNGSSDYLKEDNFTSQTDIELQFQAFNPQPYAQFGHEQFVPYLSIVDVVANLGWRATADYVHNQSGSLQNHD